MMMCLDTFFFFSSYFCVAFENLPFLDQHNNKKLLSCVILIFGQSVFSRNQICILSFMLSLLFLFMPFTYFSFLCTSWYYFFLLSFHCYLFKFPKSHAKKKKKNPQKVKVFTPESISEKEVEKSRNRWRLQNVYREYEGTHFEFVLEQQRQFSTLLANVYMFGCWRKRWLSTACSLLTSVNGSFASVLQIPSNSNSCEPLSQVGACLNTDSDPRCPIWGCKILDFPQAPRECQCYKHTGQTLKRKVCMTFPYL